MPSTEDLSYLEESDYALEDFKTIEEIKEKNETIQNEFFHTQENIRKLIQKALDLVKEEVTKAHDYLQEKNINIDLSKGDVLIGLICYDFTLNFSWKPMVKNNELIPEESFLIVGIIGSDTIHYSFLMNYKTLEMGWADFDNPNEKFFTTKELVEDWISKFARYIREKSDILDLY